MEQERIFKNKHSVWVRREDGKLIPVPESEIEEYSYGQYLPDGGFEMRDDIKHKVLGKGQGRG